MDCRAVSAVEPEGGRQCPYHNGVTLEARTHSPYAHTGQMSQ
jgi:hypothetical protein